MTETVLTCLTSRPCPPPTRCRSHSALRPTSLWPPRPGAGSPWNGVILIILVLIIMVIVYLLSRLWYPSLEPECPSLPRAPGSDTWLWYPGR